MKEVIIKTQAQLDKIKPEADVLIKIEGGTHYERIYVRGAYEYPVVACENSSVVACENSSVEARENSSVEARENSSVVARENSSVVAWGNSSVEARENSSVEAWGNSSVVACENSSVEARENSSVEAWGNSSVYLLSPRAIVNLFAYAACWLLAEGKVTKKSKAATIIKPVEKKGLTAWLDREAVEVKNNKVILYKRVSFDFKTQEKTQNETKWLVGSEVEHQAWTPKEFECGPGKFHACSRPYFCDEFRYTRGDRYVAIEVAKKDLFHWEGGDYPHKIAFRKCNVLFECDRHGKTLN